jgi:hypothetical protein
MQLLHVAGYRSAELQCTFECLQPGRAKDQRRGWNHLKAKLRHPNDIIARDPAGK